MQSKTVLLIPAVISSWAGTIHSISQVPHNVQHAEGKYTNLVMSLVFVGMFLLVLLYAFIDYRLYKRSLKKKAKQDLL